MSYNNWRIRESQKKSFNFPEVFVLLGEVWLRNTDCKEELRVVKETQWSLTGEKRAHKLTVSPFLLGTLLKNHELRAHCWRALAHVPWMNVILPVQTFKDILPAKFISHLCSLLNANQHYFLMNPFPPDFRCPLLSMNKSLYCVCICVCFWTFCLFYWASCPILFVPHYSVFVYTFNTCLGYYP